METELDFFGSLTKLLHRLKTPAVSIMHLLPSMLSIYLCDNICIYSKLIDCIVLLWGITIPLLWSLRTAWFNPSPPPPHPSEESIFSCFSLIFLGLRLSMTLLGVAGADRGFFLVGGAPLGNDVTDGEVKHVYTKKKVSSRGEGGWGRGGVGEGAHLLHSPRRSTPGWV